ncbi:MAG TPA: ABC transporter permease [Stellaceae bacterium]|nr:ABC transporter permease [Stellaceae bacterium]
MGALQSGVSRAHERVAVWTRHGLLALPIAFVAVFLVAPLLFSIAIGFWQRVGFRVQPAFRLDAYAEFFGSVRLLVLERGLIVAAEATAIGLLLAYPVAYFLVFRVTRSAARVVLALFTLPFLVNYIIRTFSWSWLLSRTGPVNKALATTGLTHAPVDWLLYSDFAVLLGLVTSTMPFMIFPIYLALMGLDRRLLEASWTLGASPARSFLRVTLPLSLSGVFAALVFGFTGAFGDSAVPIILGGPGYQLMGNAITSTLDVLNYPLSAAMSSVVVAVMLLLLLCWYLAFDLQSFLGKMLRWRF